MDDERIQATLELLNEARDLSIEDPRRERLERAASGLFRDGRRKRRSATRGARAAADARIQAATVMGATDRVMDAPLPLDPPPPDAQGEGTAGELKRPQRCYVCKDHYRRIHHFYHRLCPDCARDNLTRRGARTDLTGRRALLTGGRVKIGYQLALMLLRDGADLTVTTRFPQDAVRRFAAAPDSADWWDRLRVAALDLRDPRQVLAFTDRLLAEARPLDILINNAAQTLRRSPRAYSALAAAEAAPVREALPVAGMPAVWTAPDFTVPGTGKGELEGPSWAAGLLPRAADTAVLPSVDEAGLLVETAAENSWTARLGDIDPAEMLEVQLVNAVAPFLLADRLLPLLAASPHPRRYLLNVSAVEGRFTVRKKTGDHPHTNMAKAALNMLTRTSAAGLAKRGIHVCSVDTGWVTDEKPLPARERHAAIGWRPPLDIVDGAARVYHPIVQGQAGSPVHGVLLKDYRPVAW
ncbi:oxidoreductase [Streptomyces camponoticapitis]|uniref:Oxidoreductase n=1 Tax=Streptomyces camponoticapitis TaxID=1616125 RepID=A0ABQ2EMB4_9ACTN|nr:SDR family oxidoreductase [Streptomyces camponoticapitis]GGK14334.1 oxidoreductase [Streptomyces camponoticapitis]